MFIVVKLSLSKLLRKSQRKVYHSSEGRFFKVVALTWEYIAYKTDNKTLHNHTYSEFKSYIIPVIQVENSIDVFRNPHFRKILKWSLQYLFKRLYMQL